MLGYKLVKQEYPKLTSDGLWKDSVNLYKVGDRVKNIRARNVGYIRDFSSDGSVYYGNEHVDHIQYLVKIPRERRRY